MFGRRAVGAEKTGKMDIRAVLLPRDRSRGDQPRPAVWQKYRMLVAFGRRGGAGDTLTTHDTNDQQREKIRIHGLQVDYSIFWHTSLLLFGCRPKLGLTIAWSTGKIFFSFFLSFSWPLVAGLPERSTQVEVQPCIPRLFRRVLVEIETSDIPVQATDCCGCGPPSGPRRI